MVLELQLLAGDSRNGGTMAELAGLSQFPWEVNNVEDIMIFKNSDGTYRMSVTEKTQIGNICTKFRSVRTLVLELDELGTLTITKMEANKS
jgi:hypothetical protein